MARQVSGLDTHPFDFAVFVRAMNRRGYETQGSNVVTAAPAAVPATAPTVRFAYMAYAGVSALAGSATLEWDKVAGEFVTEYKVRLRHRSENVLVICCIGCRVQKLGAMLGDRGCLLVRRLKCRKTKERRGRKDRLCS